MELDTDGLAEGELGGEQEGATLAAAEVEEGVLLDGVGGRGGQPEIDRGSEARGRHGVVGGGVMALGTPGAELLGRDEAAGVGAVGEVEGVGR